MMMTAAKNNDYSGHKIFVSHLVTAAKNNDYFGPKLFVSHVIFIQFNKILSREYKV